MRQAALPPWPPGGFRPAEEPADDRPPLPARAGFYAVAGLIGGSVAAISVAIATRFAFPDSVPLRLIPSQLALWTGLVTPCVLVSRRFGTGRIRHDFGLVSRGMDPLIGFGLSWAGRLLATIVVVPFIVTSRRFAGSNDRVLRLVRGHPSDYALVAVIAVIGAPIVEELFFRGLLLRILETSWPAPGAIAGQAVVFGLCHISPLLGLVNVTVVVAITAFGVVQGVAAHQFRRIVPGMWSHAFFNAVAVVALAF